MAKKMKHKIKDSQTGSRANKQPNKLIKPVIGWREWVGLPDLKIEKVKAKIDTGARSSSLHAFDVKIYKRSGGEYVKFKVHPKQRSSKPTVFCSAKIIEYRKIRSSNGQTELRPVIVTPVSLLGQIWPIEVTLTNRDEMGFRMLLGRESFSNRFYIDASNSFFGNKQQIKVLKKVTLNETSYTVP
jgi:hypothetical protein